MAKDEVGRRRKRSRNGLAGYRDGGKGSQKGKVLAPPLIPKSGTDGKGPETTEELRKARLSYLEKSPDERRMLSMKYVGESVCKDIPADVHIKKVATKKPRQSASESRPRRRRHRNTPSTKVSVDEVEYVYSKSQAKNPELITQSRYIKSPARGLPTVIEEAETPVPVAQKQSRQRYATDRSIKRDSRSDASNTGSSTTDVRSRTQRRESDPIRSLGVRVQRPPSPPRRHSSSVRRFVSSHAFAAFADFALLGPLLLVKANTRLAQAIGEVPQACTHDKSRCPGSRQSAPFRQLQPPPGVRENQPVYSRRS
ncbi:MAG: hypothetical protein Q9160_006129 [Pyrenula sp. 1 TL-2023]